MPVTSTIDVERRLVLTIATGAVTLQDFLDNENRVLANPDFNPEFDDLTEFIEPVLTNASGGEVRALAAHPIFSKTSRRAIVACNAVMFGLSRMFEIYQSMGKNPPETQVFHDRASALEWLNGDRTDSELNEQ